jgi:prepilin-type N-terminal cleavage/methylation domain-containing protein
MGRSRRGFTLIEAMVVTIIVTLLAVMAMLAYRRWVHTAYLTEAQDMVKSIRAAQESFRAENGGYVNVSKGLGVGFDYPLLTPGQSKTAWGGSCSGCNNPTSGWGALNVSSTAPVVFGYSTVADNVPTDGPPSYKLTVNGSQIDLSTMTAPWYVIEADGDTNGDGVFCSVYGLSATNQVYVNNEGE